MSRVSDAIVAGKNVRHVVSYLSHCMRWIARLDSGGGAKLYFSNRKAPRAAMAELSPGVCAPTLVSLVSLATRMRLSLSDWKSVPSMTDILLIDRSIVSVRACVRAEEKED